MPFNCVYYIATLMQIMTHPPENHIEDRWVLSYLAAIQVPNRKCTSLGDHNLLEKILELRAEEMEKE